MNVQERREILWLKNMRFCWKGWSAGAALRAGGALNNGSGAGLTRETWDATSKVN